MQFDILEAFRSDARLIVRGYYDPLHTMVRCVRAAKGCSIELPAKSLDLLSHADSHFVETLLRTDGS